MREFIQRLVQWVIDAYLDVQSELLKLIAKMLGGDEQLLEDDPNAWAQLKINQLNKLNQETAGIIRKKVRGAMDRAVKALRLIGFKGIEANEQILGDAHKEGVDLDKPINPERDQTVVNHLSLVERRITEILQATNGTLLQQTEQVYRDIITSVLTEVQDGRKTPQQALRATIRQWANHGIPALIDRKGRRWSVEGYVAMVIRTTGNQVANELQDIRMDSWGIDLVEVSSHSGARPLCAPYQGRIYSRDGNNTRYPRLSSTSIGQPAGLFGVNCHHSKYPYIEGFSHKTYHPYPKEENDKIYKESQVQRRIEREIRQAKNELLMMRELGDQQGIEEAKVRIKARQAKMREFIAETDRTRRYDREQIVT